MELKTTILEGTLEVYRQKGIRFTMDDVARELAMSKKTIYTVFEDKQQLMKEMVDYAFDAIKENEQEILRDESLDTAEKIRRILGVLPERFQDLDFSQLSLLKKKYPESYGQLEIRMESEWEPTITLLQQGMEEGVVRRIHIPLFKMMLETALEQFFRREILQENTIGYPEALDEVVSILVDGILERKGHETEDLSE